MQRSFEFCLYTQNASQGQASRKIFKAEMMNGGRKRVNKKRDKGRRTKSVQLSEREMKTHPAEDQTHAHKGEETFLD